MVLRGEDRGCSAEELRHGMTKDGVQTGSGGPSAVNNLAVHLKNANVEMTKTECSGNKEYKKIPSKAQKRYRV